MTSSPELACPRSITGPGSILVALALVCTTWGPSTAAASERPEASSLRATRAAPHSATSPPIQTWMTVATAAWAWPLDPRPRVVRGFVPPTDPWGPGHRGIDLAGQPGQPVLAVAPGTVAFAGVVADVGVIVVRHGDIRSTYQPVLADVRVGDRLDAGATLGTLAAPASHCLPATCLHLGARRGDTYLDPLGLLRDLPIRLKPLDGLPGDPPSPVQLPARWTADVPAWWSPASNRTLHAPSGAWVGLAIGGA